MRERCTRKRAKSWKGGQKNMEKTRRMILLFMFFWHFAFLSISSLQVTLSIYFSSMISPTMTSIKGGVAFNASKHTKSGMNHHDFFCTKNVCVCDLLRILSFPSRVLTPGYLTRISHFFLSWSTNVGMMFSMGFSIDSSWIFSSKRNEFTSSVVVAHVSSILSPFLSMTCERRDIKRRDN